MKKVRLIIPTYNEALNLPDLCSEIFSAVDAAKFDMMLIIVDDNSPDGTGKVAEELKSKYPIKVIHRAGKLGLGSAVREGFSQADGDILGVMDADLSHDPAILNQLLDSLDQFDIAIGSRFQPGSVVESWPAWRKLTSNIGVYLAKKITGVKDPLSGYFFMKKEVIENIPLTTVGYKILFEILIKGKYRKVAELPYRFRMRLHSSSKLNLKEYMLFLEQLFKFALYKWKKNDK